MRLHIWLDDELVQELDRRAGKGRRSAFLAALNRRGLDHERRWDDIEAGFGVIPERDHDGTLIPQAGSVISVRPTANKRDRSPVWCELFLIPRSLSMCCGVTCNGATGNPSDYPMPELVTEHWPVGV